MLLSLEATDQLVSLQLDSLQLDHWPAGQRLMCLITEVCLRRAHHLSSTTPKHPEAEIHNVSLK